MCESHKEMTQELALELLRSEQMPIARYIELCRERGWDMMKGISYDD